MQKILNMKYTSVISKLLFYFFRFLAIVYLGGFTISLIALISGWGLVIEKEIYFIVNLPFTNIGILRGDFNLSYIIFMFLGPLGLYGLFFLLLSNTIRAFFQPKLFTETGVRHLKRFYLANVCIPGLFILFTSFFCPVESPTSELLILLHLVIGLFAFLLAAIFKQGLKLQNEQDLFI